MRGTDLFVADILERVGHDGDSHVDKVRRGNFKYLSAELLTILVDFLQKQTNK